MKKLIQLARRKYRSFKVSELDLVQPKPTMRIHKKEAIVRIQGVIIYATRPAWPIVDKLVVFSGWCQ